MIAAVIDMEIIWLMRSYLSSPCLPLNTSSPLQQSAMSVLAALPRDCQHVLREFPRIAASTLFISLKPLAHHKIFFCFACGNANYARLTGDTTARNGRRPGAAFNHSWRPFWRASQYDTIGRREGDIAFGWHGVASVHKRHRDFASGDGNRDACIT